MEPVIIEARRPATESPITNWAVLVLGPCWNFFQHATKALDLVKRNLGAWKLWQGPSFTLAGPALGAPAAVILLENLVAYGADHILIWGTAGSLQLDLTIGELVLVQQAIIEEGTSAHYIPHARRAEPDPQLHTWLAELFRSQGHAYREGVIWTTDAPYRETHRKVNEYQNAGVLAVEMEISALLTVARFRKIRAAAMVLISDELGTLEWKDGPSDPGFIQTCRNTIQTLMQGLCAALPNHEGE